MVWFFKKKKIDGKSSMASGLLSQKKKKWFSFEKLKTGLEKTREKLGSGFKNIFSSNKKVDENILETLEASLIQADMGVKAVNKLLQDIREAWKNKVVKDTDEIHTFLKNKLKQNLSKWNTKLKEADTKPTVILVAGVNGAGKTTSIAKLGAFFKGRGKSVLLAAGDTFRAAAVEQLTMWSKRIGADIVKHEAGSDPAAVAFDALEACISRGIDYLIIDTAGRLHTDQNLMNELAKIKRVLQKRVPDAPHEVLLVLDSTTGQNAITQAKQ
ncbi:MAG: signal recognition particle-docking protein FtsY, partial [Candidatus Anammoxibacter sp.]